MGRLLFRREDTPTIMDGLVIRYKWRQTSEISASRNGVSVHLQMDGLNRPEDLLDLKKYLDMAYRQFDMLSVGKPPISDLDLESEGE